MGGGGGKGGGKKVVYQPAPVQRDNTFAQYLSYQQERESRAEARAAQERADRQAREEARQERGRAGLTTKLTNLEQGLRSGMYSFGEAQQQLDAYGAQYDIGAATQPGAANLMDIYTKEIQPLRRTQAISTGFQDILGRTATADEEKRYMDKFKSGYYKDIDAFKQGLYQTQEYKKKNNQSYIDNYYDSIYGKQETDKDGNLTGKRTFAFSQDLMPKYAGDLKSATNVELPDYGKYFKEARTVAELDEQRQGMRASRQFVYSAGLTNLQGSIDKEISKIRDTGETKRQRIKSGSEERQALLGNALSFY